MARLSIKGKAREQQQSVGAASERGRKRTRSDPSSSASSSDGEVYSSETGQSVESDSGSGVDSADESQVGRGRSYDDEDQSSEQQDSSSRSTPIVTTLGRDRQAGRSTHRAPQQRKRQMMEAEEETRTEEEEEEPEESAPYGYNKDGSVRRKRGRPRTRGIGLSTTAKPVRSATTKLWRQYAKQERDLVCRRGGLVWQAARTLMEDMSIEQRGHAAAALKEVTRSLDAKMQTALIPGTSGMPRATKKANFSAQMGGKSYRPTLSSLMSWVLTTGGTLPEEEEEEEEEEEDISDEQAKGFNADTRILEEWLMPQINELITLHRASEAQTQDLQRAKRELKELRENSQRSEEESRLANQRIYALLADAISKTDEQNRSDVALDRMLRASAKAYLEEQDR